MLRDIHQSDVAANGVCLDIRHPLKPSTPRWRERSTIEREGGGERGEGRGEGEIETCRERRETGETGEREERGER